MVHGGGGWVQSDVCTLFDHKRHLCNIPTKWLTIIHRFLEGHRFSKRCQRAQYNYVRYVLSCHSVCRQKGTGWWYFPGTRCNVKVACADLQAFWLTAQHYSSLNHLSWISTNRPGLLGRLGHPRGHQSLEEMKQYNVLSWKPTTTCQVGWFATTARETCNFL